MKQLLAATCAMMLTMCATTSTQGLTKDQIASREKERSAWSEFGRSVLQIAVNAGVASFSNSGDRRLPNDPGLRKN